MKKLIILFVVVMGATATFAQTSKPAKSKTDTTSIPKKPVKTYTCPMHPEVTSDKPGKCPKCGMTLVEKKATKPKE